MNEMMSGILSSVSWIGLHTNDTEHHPMDSWGMMGGWWFWIIISIVVVVIIAVLIYLLNKEDRDKGMDPESKSAEKLLDERYARGEITTEEYNERKDEIKK